jgi:hypothetical protein
MLSALPLFSVLLDLTLLSPIAEFLIRWVEGGDVGLSPTAMLLIRVFLSMAYVATGYTIGALLSLENVRRRPLLGIAAALYCAPMPLLALAYSAHEPALSGAAGYGLAVLAALNAVMPLALGRASKEARGFLVYLWKRRQVERARRRRDDLGRLLIREFHRLNADIEEHARRFGERIRPTISEGARDLIERCSTHRVLLQEPDRDLPAAAPPPDDRASAPDDTSSDHRAEDSDSVTDYLREQLEGVAFLEDGLLRTPRQGGNR